VVLRRLAQVQLEEDLRDVRVDGLSRQEQRLGNCTVRPILGDEHKDLSLSFGQHIERTVGTLTREQPRDDRRVDHAQGEISPLNFRAKPWRRISDTPSRRYFSKRCPPSAAALRD
jgi:hypothetical protein